MSDLEALIRVHDEGWNSQDLDTIMATYVGDIVFQNHTAGEEATVGAEGVRAHLAGIFERWPDLHFTGRRLYITDTVCVSEWTASATKPDGGRIEWDGVDVFPIRDGLIARKDVYSTSHIARSI
ncbi:MAG: hypothetical protein QOH68_3322 [Nocardioidaceae bacterium]|jgi:ketosteroid isomerase-like protein|nr:hypothetical protein [Nocardioidaceae bacterium]